MQDIYNAIDKKLSDDSVIDLIFNNFDIEFRAGNFNKVDSILEDLDIDKLNTVLLIAILSITHSARDKLCSRECFIRRIRAKFEKTESHRVDRLLKNYE